MRFWDHAMAYEELHMIDKRMRMISTFLRWSWSPAEPLDFTTNETFPPLLQTQYADDLLMLMDSQIRSMALFQLISVIIMGVFHLNCPWSFLDLLLKVLQSEPPGTNVEPTCSIKAVQRVR